MSCSEGQPAVRLRAELVCFNQLRAIRRLARAAFSQVAKLQPVRTSDPLTRHRHLMTNERHTSIDITHTVLAVLFLVTLIISSFQVLSPFLVAILWATIVSVSIWPVFLKLEAFLGGRRGVAVAVMTAVILFAVFIPLTLALVTITRNAQGITVDLRSLESIALPAPPAWLERIPVVGPQVIERWTVFGALDSEGRIAALTPHLQSALQWFVAKAGTVGAMLLQFLLTTIVTAIFLANGEQVRKGILMFAERLAGRQGHDVAVLAARAIRSVVLGVVVTALLQSALGGIGLFLSGIPAAGLLAAVMLFLCLAQIGPMLILAPSLAWLYWSGQTFWGTMLLVITIITSAVDNIVRPLLIKRGANLPLLLIFSGVIGGLISFGIIGLFIGPVVLAVTYTLLKAWVATGEEPHRAPPAP